MLSNNVVSGPEIQGSTMPLVFMKRKEFLSFYQIISSLTYYSSSPEQMKGLMIDVLSSEQAKG